MNDTGIIWTEATWNPMSGCQKVSAGCKYCYALTLAEAKRGTPAFPNGFDLTIRPHKLKEPFKLKNPTLIFANSMSDLFWDQVPESYRDQIVDVIEQTPQHEYQVLTKRPELMLEYSRRRKLPPNFWAGVTIENETSLHRLEILKQVDAEIRFISFEPLIGPMPSDLDLSGISWAITGGESGSHMWKDDICEKRGLVFYDRQVKSWFPRPDRMDWIRNIRDICIRDGAKFFHKQWGGNYPEACGRELDGRFWTEMPRLPGQRVKIENSYLDFIEAGGKKKAGEKDQLLQQSLFQ